MGESMVGKVLAGRYRVDAFIAAGGMGAVYRVWDLKRRVPLAMKVLKGEWLDDPHVFKRFLREAEALKKLRHPNIVRFYGLYREGDVAFLLENYVDGWTLREIVRRRRRERRPLKPKEVLGVLRAVSAALAYAHDEHGMVHCDIKPDNIMVDKGGNVWLMDFGIMRHADSTGTTILGAGTMAYMAPEQLRQEERVSPATDVYALGIMAYELLTGRRPFDFTGAGSTAARLARLQNAHLNMPPPDPRKFRPDIPAAVAKVLLRALEKAPERRYRNAWAFYAALAQAYGVQPETVPARVPALALSDSDSETTLPPPPPPPGGGRGSSRRMGADGSEAPTMVMEEEQAPSHRNPWLWIGLLGAVLLACLVVGGAAALLISQQSGHGGEVRAVSPGERSASAPPTAAAAPRSVSPSSGASTSSGALATFTPLPTYTPWPTYTPVPSPTLPSLPGGTWKPCEDARPSRLKPGMRARVTYNPPLPNRVRSAPGLDKRRIGWLQTGEEMEILDGPACASNMVWWKIRSLRSGLVGWTSEGDYDNYWLEPVR